MFSPNYKEADYIVKVVKRGSGEETRYVPDLPELPFGLVLCYVGDVNYYAYPLPPETLGLDCLCHCVYHAKDDAVMQAWPGKLGQGSEVCKKTEYKSVVKQTVGEKAIADEKAKLTAEAEAKGEVVKQEDLDAVKYNAPDANDGIPVWKFLDEGYEDK